jgi:uncharacterized protein Yka (UPF0111/DUF47 family)
MNIDELITQLEALDSQFVHDRGNVFARMAKCANDVRESIKRINLMLCVEAAEYVPAIQDVFEEIDTLHIKEIEDLMSVWNRRNPATLTRIRTSDHTSHS